MSLVKKLMSCKQEVSCGRLATFEEFQEAVEQGYLLLDFESEHCRTELGISIIKERCECVIDAPESRNTEVVIVGTCHLDFEKIEIIAEINRSDLRGSASVSTLEK